MRERKNSNAQATPSFACFAANLAPKKSERFAPCLISFCRTPKAEPRGPGSHSIQHYAIELITTSAGRGADRVGLWRFVWRLPDVQSVGARKRIPSRYGEHGILPAFRQAHALQSREAMHGTQRSSFAQHRGSHTEGAKLRRLCVIAGSKGALPISRKHENSN